MSSFQVYPPSSGVIDTLINLDIVGSSAAGSTDNFSFVAGGASSTTVSSIQVSPDGLLWSPCANDPFGTAGGCIGLCFNGQLILAAGFDGGRTVSFAYSYNGYNWTPSDNSIFSGGGGSGKACAWSPSLSRFVGGGRNGAETVCLGYSNDNGITWTASPTQLFTGSTGLGSAVTGMCWSPQLNLFVAGGFNASLTQTLCYSSDGISWILSTSNPFPGGSCYGVCWSPSLSLFVAVGQSAGYDVHIVYSTDGKSWTQVIGDPFDQGNCSCVTWSEQMSLFVAGGTDVTGAINMAYSQNGKIWFASTSPIRPYKNGLCQGVTYAGNRFVCVGASPAGDVTSLVSYDGKTWTIPSQQPFPTTAGNGIVSTNLFMPLRGPQGAKTFIIDHPIDNDKYLIHACLEGPEAAVYYRGSGITGEDKKVEITLPDYVDTFSKYFTVYISPVCELGSAALFDRVGASNVIDGKFTVYSESALCKFDWLVIATRAKIDVEVLKSQVNVQGDGPYKYL